MDGMSMDSARDESVSCFCEASFLAARFSEMRLEARLESQGR